MHSITRLRLDEFRRRRNLLLIVRGLAAAVAALLVATVFCAFIDARWIIEPLARWKMATCVYGIAILTLVWFVISPWIRGRSQKYLADQFEQIEPRLRERLVAAVELSDDSKVSNEKGATQFGPLDSRAFREALQQSVAHRIEAVDVRSTLPWRLVAKWTWLTCGVMLVLALLCCIPSLYMPNRIGRVLLPMIDIGRVSRFAVEILQPTADHQMIPEEEVQLIQARVRGGLPGAVSLEWRHEKNESSEYLALSVDSNSQDQDIFETHWTPPFGSTRFRVVADGAVSVWHVFETAPRPRVESFEIEYKFPSYTEQPNDHQHSDKGDLRGLTGTKASLGIETNLDKVSGELVILPKDRSRVADHSQTHIPLSRNGEGKLTAEIPIDFPATYRVSLTTIDNGFTNSYSPSYAIVALDDLAPRLRWKSPEQSGLSIKPNELLSMSVMIEDEVPIASLKQRTRVGQGEWRETACEVPAQSVDTAEFALDVLPLHVQPGDIVQVQVVAADRKRQTAFTDILDLYVSSLTLDPLRQATLKKRSEVVVMIEDFESQLRAKHQDLAAVRDRIAQEPTNDLAKNEFQKAILSLAETTQQQASRIRAEIVSQLPKIQDTVASEEYELLGRNLSRLENETIPLRNSFAAMLNANSSSKPVNDDGWKKVDNLLQDVSNLSRRSRDFVSHDLLSQVGQDLKVLLNSQQEIASNFKKLQPEQFRRRQALIGRQMQDLATLLRDNLPTLRNRGEKAGKQWLDWIESQASKILEVTGKPERPSTSKISLSDGQRLIDQTLKELQRRQNAGTIDSQLATEQIKSRDDLDKRSPKASQLLNQLAETTKRSLDPTEREATEEQLQRFDLPALEQLASQREIQQARNDGDEQFVADLGEAYRAAQSVLGERSTDTDASLEKLERLQSSMEKLESIHATKQAVQTLDQLYAGERWESGTLDVQFEQPRVWEAFQQQLSGSLKALRKSGLPEANIAELEEILKSDNLKRIGEKIDPRRWSSSPSASAATEVESLNNSLKASLLKLESAELEARQTLTALTPSVSQLAREAARKAELSREETEQLEKALARNEVPDTKPRMKQLEHTVEANEPTMKQLREGLADLASRQDLMRAGSSRVARDADAAISLTRDAGKRLNESFEAVRAALPDNDQTRASLVESAKVQSDVAESFDKIADHFEKLAQVQDDSGNRPNEDRPPPSTLAELSKELEKSSEMSKTHNDADRLRRLATLDPQRVLAELERELKRNQPMQAELSQISKEAVDDALKTLGYTADQEKELHVDFENSDPEFLAKKEELRNEIKRSAQAARKIAENLSPRITTSAERAHQPEITKRSQQFREGMQRVAEQVDSVDTSDSFEEIVQAAQELLSGLETYRSQTQRHAEMFDAASTSTKVVPPNQHKAYQRMAEDLRSRYRDEDIRRAFDLERDRMQETKSTQQLVKRTEQQVEQRSRSLAEAKERLDKRPEQEQSIKDVQRRATELQSAEKDLQQAKASESRAAQRQSAAKEIREAVQLQKTEPLNKANPVAELGVQVAADAAKAAKQILDELNQALTAALQGPPAEAQSDTFASGMEDQAELQADVSEASQDLSRAARHEQRLTKAAQSELLDQQAQKLSDISKGSMEQARQQMSEAKKGKASSKQATSQSQQALSAAESALRQQAQALQQAFAGPTKGEKAAPGPSRTAPSNSSNPLLSPQELARMLDELDLLLNASKNDSAQAKASSKQNSKSTSAPGQHAKSGTDGEPTESSPPESTQTLSQAVERLASEMNQQRQAMESSSQNMPSTGAPESQSRSPTQPGQSTAGVVPAIEILNLEDWGKLREQSSEDAREGNREEIPSAYRLLVEEYFRRLSKRKPATP